MITRERLLFFLWSLGLFGQVSWVLPDSQSRPVVLVLAGMALAAAALTAFFSVRPRIACYVSSAIFGAVGVFVFVRDFPESLSQTMTGIAIVAGAAFLFLWPRLRSSVDLG